MASFIKPSSGTKTSRRAFAPVAEINVTPMVDVMLVLLVIFIVTAPLLTTGVNVNLPQTSRARSLPQPAAFEPPAWTPPCVPLGRGPPLPS